MKHSQWIALPAALLLALSLLAGCGKSREDPVPPPAPAAAQEDEPAQPAVQPEGPQEPAAPAAPETGGSEPTAPAAQETEGSEPADGTPAAEEPSVPAEGEAQSSAPVEAPETPANPEPPAAPAQPEKPAPAGQDESTALEDGTYTASVTLEGGSGRASVDSPAKLRCEDGKIWATIVWSSPYFDYMKVDGERYEQVNTEGNSTFEIPVAAFDTKLDVVADTVAMSEPHEVAYTLQFDSASLEKA